MSFASVTGSCIGQRSTIPFTAVDDGSLAMGQTVAVITTTPPLGTYVFTASFSVFSGSVLHQEMALEASCKVTYDDVIIAKHRVDGQYYDDVCLTGILFSDGIKTLTLKIKCENAEPGESATAWGYTDGTLDFIRITDR